MFLLFNTLKVLNNSAVCDGVYNTAYYTNQCALGVFKHNDEI